MFEIGRQQYEPLLRAHPEWLDELALIMEERLARRHERDARLEAVAAESLSDRIRRNFFFTTG